MIHPDTHKYIESLEPADRAICEALSKQIDAVLSEAENKLWHAIPSGFSMGIRSSASAS